MARLSLVVECKLLTRRNISLDLRGRDRRQEEDALFVATKSSVIYRISISESMIDVQELFKVKESVASLLTIPNKSPSQGQSLVVVGTKGTVSWSKITQPDQEGRSVASTPKNCSFNEDVQSAFAVEGHLYILSGAGRVLRLPLASLESTDNKNLEIMDLPPLCALSPALSHGSTTIEGLYGLNQRGQLLRFPADWIKHARPQEVANARDTVGGVLSELERLSDQVKKLEIQCQMENQRIATYNRLVYELQQSVLASSRQQDVGNSSISGGGEDVEMETEMQMEPGLLIETSLSTFAHVVSDGYDGTKRFYARLRIKSRANIDWSHGWSVGVNMASKVEFCSHGKPTTNASSQHHPDSKRKTRMHHQTFANLRTLTRQTPWTLDIELDRDMIHFLPLQVSIGLLFRELGSDGGNSGSVGNFKVEKEGFAAYFVVDSVDLDVLDFVEGVEDPLKRDIPAFAQRQHPRPTSTTSYSNNNMDQKDDEEECHQCKGVRKGNSSDTNTGTSMTIGTGGMDAASLFRPIEFEIDTTSIPIPQCLSALLFLESDNNSHYKAVKVIDMLVTGGRQGIGMGMEAMVQACFRTCFILPDECLSSHGSTSLIRPMLTMSATEMQGQGHRNNFGMDAMAARSLSGSRNWGGGVILGAEVAGGLQIEDPDLKMVWVDLEVPATGAAGGGSYDHQPQQQRHVQGKEGVVRAHVLVRGSDLERVHVVRQALEKRIRALFD
ncbi:hypothetical protein BGX24_009389 [Mortierella sp. AD032]|nr:hypothetical protein BGX24_009389 [Mortierella sp. AD032]